MRVVFKTTASQRIHDMTRSCTRVAAYFVLAVTPVAATAQVEVIGGFTSVALDTDTLSAAASLDLSSVSPGIGAGSLAGSVA
ncbi:MAG: hypothetical protein AAF449_09560, partial [Myxococcota bacterium]